MNSASFEQEPVDMAGVRLTALHPDFVGRVSGLDLGRGITDAQRHAIDTAMERFAVHVPQQVESGHPVPVVGGHDVRYPRDLRRVTVQGLASTLEDVV